MSYQVKDWCENFENDRSRQRDRCSFVCVPNKQHGIGLARILSLEDGLAIYGVWCLVLGACSQQKLPRDGWLTDNGLPSGSPWTHRDLALKFRRKESEIERALTVLSSSEIGWLHESNRALTADSPRTPLVVPWKEGKKEGKEQKEGDGVCVKTAADRVSEFEEAKTLVNRLYGAGRRWSSLEDGLLAEIVRAGRFREEYDAITSYRHSLLPADRAKYFPQSVSRLLEKWHELLDRARVTRSGSGDSEVRKLLKEADNL